MKCFSIKVKLVCWVCSIPLNLGLNCINPEIDQESSLDSSPFIYGRHSLVGEESTYCNLTAELTTINNQPSASLEISFDVGLVSNKNIK